MGLWMGHIYVIYTAFDRFYRWIELSGDFTYFSKQLEGIDELLSAAKGVFGENHQNIFEDFLAFLEILLLEVNKGYIVSELAWEEAIFIFELAGAVFETLIDQVSCRDIISIFYVCQNQLCVHPKIVRVEFRIFEHGLEFLWLF